MKILKDIEGLTELNACEQRKITGGESPWYYLGYALGRGYRFLADALETPSNSPCVNTN